MSEPKLISPMLDNFEMGGPISDHDGVRCCPAMRKNSDEKYIVKIISVPASQTKLDALLLTGAYPDKNAALAYFKELADGIIDEKKVLDSLSQLEGFIPFEDCQIVPMDDATGYDVYLLSEYRTTLERQNARAPMTQLAAVNLGLDLCAGLAVCRRSGYMCVDLKPSNIFVVGDKEYRIGDLGFVRLNSLKYESLPDKYRSSYTAPELEDAFAALNDTIDIYAVGLILYQVFNGGALPFSGKNAPGEKFEAPAYADEEMAQIILKACDPDPSERWQDPVEMGQAIVSYMQKNSVNETPLTAEFFAPENEEILEDDFTEKTAEDEILEEGTVENVDSEDLSEVETVSEAADEEPVSTIVDAPDDVTDEQLVEAAVMIPEEEPAAEETFEEQSIDAETNEPEETADSNVEAQDEEYDNLSFLDDAELVLAEVGDDYSGVTDEVSEMLGQIDELTAHQVPDPVVAPEPIEIKLPDPIVMEEEEPAEEPDVSDDEETADSAENIEDASVSEDSSETEDEEIPEEEMPYVPKKKRTGLIWGIVLAVVLALAVGAYFFYTQYYLQPIHSLELSGTEDMLQVQLTADIDESMLTVVCADSHGNKVSAPVAGGTAVFSGLAADTAYTVSVEVDGFHELTGVTSKVYSTPVQTKIAQTSVVTGSESGSVILSFTVEGPDSNQWNVIYNAEGEAERVTAFPAHMVTLAGLTVGKEYTFRLEPADDIYIRQLVGLLTGKLGIGGHHAYGGISKGCLPKCGGLHTGGQLAAHICSRHQLACGRVVYISQCIYYGYCAYLYAALKLHACGANAAVYRMLHAKGLGYRGACTGPHRAHRSAVSRVNACGISLRLSGAGLGIPHRKVKYYRRRYYGNHAHAYIFTYPLLLKVLHCTGCRIKAVGAAAGQHDSLYALNGIISPHKVGFPCAGGAAPHIHAAHRAVFAQNNSAAGPCFFISVVAYFYSFDIRYAAHIFLPIPHRPLPSPQRIPQRLSQPLRCPGQGKNHTHVP